MSVFQWKKKVKLKTKQAALKYLTEENNGKQNAFHSRN